MHLARLHHEDPARPDVIEVKVDAVGTASGCENHRGIEVVLMRFFDVAMALRQMIGYGIYIKPGEDVPAGKFVKSQYLDLLHNV